ncbi:MAG: PQQ-dependent dehydrogenase, methanol/ethanol family [Deltaproteobacteria bacterium]|nr:PQQ-dependent dehydrogenase, methanol/ethanol family [Deltaproteobacteria bacterium]
MPSPHRSRLTTALSLLLLLGSSLVERTFAADATTRPVAPAPAPAPALAPDHAFSPAKPGVAARDQVVVDDDLLARERPGRTGPPTGVSSTSSAFSPLAQIDRANVGRLGIAWTLELPELAYVTTVPLAVDGIVYFTAGYSVVHAVDARSGRILWRHDPEVRRAPGHKMLANWGARGLAFWKGRVYVGTADGRLVALEARTGTVAWSVRTFPLDDQRYISGAPRVFDGKVVIGHGGADFGPIRGYVTTYDAETGRQLWRFHVVPGNPADGFESEAMAMAARTWKGEWWKHGGGGTVWNAITYDPELDRIYLGTGNGAPWNQKIRSPGGGDNLFLCSVVALDADTGEYVWHYQTTPGETWDYNSAMDMVLAELELEGRRRKVLLHAPKNGFFYVLDRETGKLISAEKIARVTWAERIDLASGRPVEHPEARFAKGGALVAPDNGGAHSWHPMAFSPATGLAYVPVRESQQYYSDRDVDLARWQHPPGMIFSTGLSSTDAPPPGAITAPTSALLAWNPATQREAWRVPTPGGFGGGVLTTAGGLVFQADAAGRLNAYDDATGKSLWSSDLGVGTLAPPITYTVDGRQHVSILAGFFGGPTALGAPAARFGWVGREQPRRLVTFVLDGQGRLPRPSRQAQALPLAAPEFVVDPKKVERGARTFGANCVNCHGVDAVAGGAAPDLRASPIPLSLEAFDEIVRGGSLAIRGMPRFDWIEREDLDAMRHYLRQRARDSLEAATGTGGKSAKAH